jgi:hypothetical protein
VALMFDPDKLNQFVVISLFSDEDGKQNAKKQSFLDNGT